MNTTEHIDKFEEYLSQVEILIKLKDDDVSQYIAPLKKVANGIIRVIPKPSKIALSNKLTQILEHTPSIIISKGQLDMNTLKENDLSINQLLGLLRDNGYDSIKDIEYAILEPQGKLSVFPVPDKNPVTIKDLKLQSKPSGITMPLVVDGCAIDINLKYSNYNKSRLMKELKVKEINDIKDVFLAELESSGNLVVCKKDI